MLATVWQVIFTQELQMKIFNFLHLATWFKKRDVVCCGISSARLLHYKEPMVAVVDEEWPYIKEPTNREYQFAVTVTKDPNIVDHMPMMFGSLVNVTLTIQCVENYNTSYGVIVKTGGFNSLILVTY